MDTIEQIRKLAPYLDSHMLLLLFQRNIGKESENLQDQIKAKLVAAGSERAKTMQTRAQEKASKLLSLLEDKKKQELRKDQKFNFEKMRADHGVQIDDCQSLFDYARILYELQQYETSRKHLIDLKEILTNESSRHFELVSQVYWGLFACDIQLCKKRENVELTTVRKLKDMVRARYAQNPMYSHQNASWLLNWCLIYSFTAEHTNGMFAALLADRENFGFEFINVIELRSQYLMRHMIAAFLLGRSSYQPNEGNKNLRLSVTQLQVNALPTIALPVIKRSKAEYQDSFTKFTEALFDDFDFEAATEHANQMHLEAKNDILLKPHASEIRRQALLYIFEVKARLSTNLKHDLKAFCEEFNVPYPDIAIDEVKKNMKRGGLVVRNEGEGGSTLYAKGNLYNVKGKIHSATTDLVRKSETLNSRLMNHQGSLAKLKDLKTKTEQEEAETKKAK